LIPGISNASLETRQRNEMLTCGQNSVIAREHIGCGKLLEDNDVVLCPRCKTPFHAECLKAHLAQWTRWGAQSHHPRPEQGPSGVADIREAKRKKLLERD
jgi:Prokaryotic RING finger family 1